MKPTGHEGYNKLKKYLNSHAPAAIAFSGGTDSTFLLFVANHTMPGQFKAFTFDTPYMTRSEIREARNFCEKHKIPHTFIPLSFPEKIRNNPQDRCYLCKFTLFGHLKNIALQEGFPMVFDGTNQDDTQYFRPGRKALTQLGIRSPLLENGLRKKDIRTLSMSLGLPSWNKPSNACLLTRLPYNHPVSEEQLHRVEQAEDFIHQLGFRIVRVRTHETLARIEVAQEDLYGLLQAETRKKISDYLKKIGYLFVTIDLEGYRTGSYDINQ